MTAAFFTSWQLQLWCLFNLPLAGPSQTHATDQQACSCNLKESVLQLSVSSHHCLSPAVLSEQHVHRSAATGSVAPVKASGSNNSRSGQGVKRATISFSGPASTVKGLAAAVVTCCMMQAGMLAVGALRGMLTCWQGFSLQKEAWYAAAPVA